MMGLCSDKLTISKLDNIELRELTGEREATQTLGMKPRVRSNCKQEQALIRTGNK
jgi:hypothetical protein